MQQLEDGTWDLDLEGAAITDVTILKGAPISRLNLNKTVVSDLLPLQGMPLEFLILGGTAVTDLSVLRGMPLSHVSLINCQKLTDLSPLAEAKGLTMLILPPNAKAIEFLRTFPNLERLSFTQAQPQTHLPGQPVAEFWKEWDARK